MSPYFVIVNPKLRVSIHMSSACIALYTFILKSLNLIIKGKEKTYHLLSIFIINISLHKTQSHLTHFYCLHTYIILTISAIITTTITFLPFQSLKHHTHTLYKLYSSYLSTNICIYSYYLLSINLYSRHTNSINFKKRKKKKNKSYIKLSVGTFIVENYLTIFL